MSFGLPNPVGEHRPTICDAVDVRCPVAHHTLIVSADVEALDVIAPDDRMLPHN
jgi:hypothetical protein